MIFDVKHAENFAAGEKGCGDESANGRLISVGIKNDDIDGVDYIEADDVDDKNDIFDLIRYIRYNNCKRKE